MLFLEGMNANKPMKFFSINTNRIGANLPAKNLIFYFVLYSLIPAATTEIHPQSDEQLSDTTEVIFEMEKSPWTAVLLSAAVPGLGQIYNESHYKAPIIWALSGWLIYNWVDNNNLKNDYADLYIQTGNESYRFLRTTYQDRRDEFAIYLGLVYVLNLVDAYVDAHLFDFSVDDLNSPGRSSFRVSLHFNF